MDELKLSEDEWNNFKLIMYFYKREISYSLKMDVRLLIQERVRAIAEDKQVFIFSYLQDLHLYILAILGLHVLDLNLVKDIEFNDSKFCRIVKDFLLYQQGLKQLFCKCNRNLIISHVCLNLQYYKPICLPCNQEDLILTPDLLLDYGIVYQIVCSNPN